MNLIVSSMVALVSNLATVPASPACESDCTASSQSEITARTAKESLNELLAAEGLARPAAAEVLVRRAELDGNPNTVEALVDVLSLETCIGGNCTTLVVRATASGLVAMGHGQLLLPLQSKSCGWTDLAETSLPLLPVRALRFSNGRYL